MNDGLAGLSDREIMYKVREVPTKIKKHLKHFSLKLIKSKVKLDENGELDFSECKNPKMIEAYYRGKETTAKIALMYNDIEYEYPHKLERLQIKADMMNLIEAEEQKLKDKTRWDREKELRSRELNYEEYYQNYIQNHVEQLEEEKNTWI